MGKSGKGKLEGEQEPGRHKSNYTANEAIESTVNPMPLADNQIGDSSVPREKTRMHT